MENSEYIELIKMLLKGKAKEKKNVSISFFEDVRLEIFAVLGMMPGAGGLTDGT